MKKLVVPIVTLLVLACITRAEASIEIDPDDYNPGAVLNTVDPGVTLSAVRGCTPNTTPNGDVIGVVDVTGAPGLAFGSFCDPSTVDPTWRGARARFVAEFTVPVAFVSIDIKRTHSTTPDQALVLAFDKAPTDLEALYPYLAAEATDVIVVDVPEDPITVTISHSIADIKFIVASGMFDCVDFNDDVVIDKLRYNVDPVPEPSSFVIFLFGSIIALGFWRRQRTRR